ncbi:MAG: LrgB family protein [Firmicutes bacterium]|nr:LrgB family protein [Bacillota bacterium]
MIHELSMVAMTVIFYILSTVIYKKFKTPLLNPILVSTIFIIATLMFAGMDYEAYDMGGRHIKFFLGPSIVILAIPLHRQFHILKKSYKPILGGIITGIIVSFITVVGLSKLFNLNRELMLSIVPKSITTPMGILVTSEIGGLESITIASIILTGIIGAVLAPTVMKVFRIKNNVAVGIGIGTSSHAVGTSKAVEMGEVEGAMSSLSIAVAGLITVLLTPLIQIALNLI